ncbi:ribonuclease P protein component [Candidatus Riesia pediculischaeffi]|uniref:ribonuclease P protein component n=1 Tax=Candidatus Riesia pediculischaeffi TaxID=428411 RepID=UPI00069889A3|nr:ribonuclease P protein component [Candidatus Riesia pediculischaeffi]
MKFPKCLRLSKKRDFDRIFRDPEKIFLHGITMLVKKNSLKYPRLGLMVSKKNIKKSFARNKIKRLFREYFRINCIYFKKMDFVILVKKDLKNLKNVKINAMLNRLWERYHIFRK